VILAGQPVVAAMRQAARALKREGVPDAQGDVRWLMAEALGTGRDRLILAELDELTEGQASTFSELVQRRMAREPVSRILGRRNFYGRDFRITPYVLDPRPETEILVEQALREPFSEILDLGTGSGCIALTLLAERPEATAIATDISPDALDTAGANAAALGLLGRVHFERSDWFDCVGGTYDLIVSNPPYIAPDEILTLAPEVERCDPKIALFDTADGLTAYRRIAAQAPAHLKPNGRLLVEIGPTQAAAVTALFEAAGLADILTHPDLDGRDRVVAARRP
jgi:release factor glutamine methyltransferase